MTLREVFEAKKLFNNKSTWKKHHNLQGYDYSLYGENRERLEDFS